MGTIGSRTIIFAVRTLCAGFLALTAAHCTLGEVGDLKTSAGNQLGESGETCVNGCPDVLNDGDACTQDVVIRISPQRTVTCTHARVAACDQGDGGCPPTFYRETDADGDSSSTGPECGDRSCDADETCRTCPLDCGTCPTCSSSCDDRECGPDGCGGECGTCPLYEACSDNGSCESVWLPTGYGIGFYHQMEQHERWIANWHLVDVPGQRILPMVTGGPRAVGDDTNPLGIGTKSHPGCANAGQPGCNENDPLVQEYFAMIEEYAQSYPEKTVWLLYNEPDYYCPNGDCYPLDAAHAAWLYDRIYDRVLAINPQVLFFCCGTNPGITKSNWMADFAPYLTRPLHGLHVHNYAAPDLLDSEATIQVMTDFHAAMQRIPAFAGKKILISEWSGLSATSQEQNRDQILRPVAQWLNQNAATYDIIGAAWFWSGTSHLPSHEPWHNTCLFDPNGAKTALGLEYLDSGPEQTGYIWGVYP